MHAECRCLITLSGIRQSGAARIIRHLRAHFSRILPWLMHHNMTPCAFMAAWLGSTRCGLRCFAYTMMQPEIIQQAQPDPCLNNAHI